MIHLAEEATKKVIWKQKGCNVEFVSDVYYNLDLALFNEMPSHSQQWWLHPWNCSRLASQVLHTNAAPNCFYPALSGSFAVKCTFSLLFFFSAHHVSSSVLTARE